MSRQKLLIITLVIVLLVISLYQYTQRIKITPKTPTQQANNIEDVNVDSKLPSLSPKVENVKNFPQKIFLGNYNNSQFYLEWDAAFVIDEATKMPKEEYIKDNSKEEFFITQYKDSRLVSKKSPNYSFRRGSTKYSLKDGFTSSFSAISKIPNSSYVRLYYSFLGTEGGHFFYADLSKMEFVNADNLFQDILVDVSITPEFFSDKEISLFIGYKHETEPAELYKYNFSNNTKEKLISLNTLNETFMCEEQYYQYGYKYRYDKKNKIFSIDICSNRLEDITSNEDETVKTHKLIRTVKVKF